MATDKAFQKHETNSMIINGERVDIDNDIYHIVEWLNSINNVITYTSCQGDKIEDWKNGFMSPYISMFISSNDETTLGFIEKVFLDWLCHIEKEYNPTFIRKNNGFITKRDQSMIRLTVRWDNYEQMRQSGIPS